MEAHIFQLKDEVPASAGGGTMWLSMGSPRKCSIPTLLWKYSQHLSSLPRIGDHYNGRSWYWTIQESMTLWPSIQIYSWRWGDSYWNGTVGVSVDGRTRSEVTEQIALTSQPEEAREEGNREGLARAEDLRTLARNQKKQNKGGRWTRKVPCRI